MSNQLVKKDYSEGYRKVFPKTFIDAIKDRETGMTLAEILQGFNMYFLSYNGNKAETRNQVPPLLRKEGLWITYVLYDHTVVSEWYDNSKTDDDSWGSDENWRIASNALVGDISVSADGYWVINGIKTTSKARGERGTTPLLRIYDNKLQVSYTDGKTYNYIDDNPVFTQYRTYNNKIQVSRDLGKTWEDASEELAYKFKVEENKLKMSKDLGHSWETISDYIAAQFRWVQEGTSNNIGKIQISRDEGRTWSNLTNSFSNNLHISRYIGANESLPTTGIAEGTIYMKGPYYDENDTNNDYPIYRMWVYAWKGNTLAWQDNGEFQSIVAGVVQERGDSELNVMSQAAITKELTELESKVTGSSEYFINKGTYISTQDGIIYDTPTEYSATTDYIRLSELSRFEIKGGRNGNRVALYAYYDKEKKFLSYYDSDSNASVNKTAFPNDAEYIVFTGYSDGRTILLLHSIYDLYRLSEKNAMGISNNAKKNEELSNAIEINALDEKRRLTVKTITAILGGGNQFTPSPYYVANGIILRDIKETAQYRSYIFYIPAGVKEVSFHNADAATNLYLMSTLPKLGESIEAVAERTLDGTTKHYSFSNPNGIYGILGLNINSGNIEDIELQAQWLQSIEDCKAEIEECKSGTIIENREDITSDVDRVTQGIVYNNSVVGAEYSQSSYDSMQGLVINVAVGERYIITGRGGNTYRLWAKVLNGKVIANQAYTANVDEVEIICDGSFNQLVVNVVSKETHSIIKIRQLKVNDAIVEANKEIDKLGGVMKGKTVVLLGDSQVGQETEFEKLLNQMLPINAINCGFAGCRMALRTDDASSPYDAFSAIGVADAIVSRDFSAMDNALASLKAEGSYYYELYAPRVEALKEINLGDGDNCIMTIAYGSNDFSGGNEIGEASTLNKRTLLGAMQYVIEILLKAFPKLQLIFVGMPYRVYSHEGNDVISDSNDYVSSKGYHRYDYSDAILDNAKANQLPCFDMYRRCGRNRYNIFTICPDGTHPTSAYGQKLTAELYGKILQSF